MNLREWATKKGIQPTKHGSQRAVPIDRDDPDLHKLSDWKVSSVAAGSIWLILMPDKRHKRNNIRNFFLTATRPELEQAIVDRKDDPFAVECLTELIEELE